MQLSSRHHAQICTKVAGPVDLGPVPDDHDQPGALGPAPHGREQAPAVERRQREVDDERVEPLPPEQGQGGVAVARDPNFGVDGISRMRSVLDHEHARDHRAPPP